MAHALSRILFAVLALTLGFGAYAADKDKKGKGGLSGDDREFVEKALMDGATEVELGKLAQGKAASDAVKQFGRRMVTDHSKAGEELKGIASKVGYTPKHDGPDQKMVKKLSDKSGAAFDREYADMMVEDHEKAVKLFRRQADKGDNGELKQFASKTLPTLEEHLKMARDLKKTAGQKK